MITLFIDQEAQDLLDDIGSTFPEASNKLDATVEFRQLALTGVVKYDSDNLDITVYERDEAMTRTRLGGHGTVVDMELNVDKGDFDTVAVVAGVSDLMNNYLYGKKLVEEYKDLDEESGILVEAKDGEIVTSIVSGKDRPDLRCRMISGEKKMYRPYTDEAFEAFKNS